MSGIDIKVKKYQPVKKDGKISVPSISYIYKSLQDIMTQDIKDLPNTRYYVNLDGFKIIIPEMDISFLHYVTYDAKNMELIVIFKNPIAAEAAEYFSEAVEEFTGLSVLIPDSNILKEV